MATKFHNDKESIDWLLETHLKDNEDFDWIKLHLRSFIISGNEDCPDLIECYSATMPFFGNDPFFVRKGEV